MKIYVIILRDKIVEEKEEQQNYTYDLHCMFPTIKRRDAMYITLRVCWQA